MGVAGAGGERQAFGQRPVGNKVDPVGRSKRTGVAAMAGVYGPASAARRLIGGVTRMHARVGGTTPAGQTCRALDPQLLNWVHATAAYGFLTAYCRFVRPLGQRDRNRSFAEGRPVAKLYGVTRTVDSDADFTAMMAELRPDPASPAWQSAIRQGLPGDFAWRTPDRQQRLLASRHAAGHGGASVAGSSAPI